MAEVAFAKQFLSTLDTRPIKISADHVEDPRTYPARQPYILPTMPRPLPKRRPGDDASAAAASSSSSSGGGAPADGGVVVRAKSPRNPVLDIALPPLSPATTSVLDVRAAVAARARVPLDKVKLLWKKRPAADTKTLAELLAGEDAGGAGGEVEFGIMVLGGAASVLPPDEPAAAAAAAASAGTSAKEKGVVLAAAETDEFWSDLRGFLLQRVKNEKQAGELFETFQGAWKAKR